MMLSKTILERSACVHLSARATPSRPSAPLVRGVAGRARASASPCQHHGTPSQDHCGVFVPKFVRGLNQSGRNLNHECSLLFYVGRSSNTLCCSQKKKYIEMLVMVARNDFETPNSLAVKSSTFFFPFLLTIKLPKVTNKQNEGSKYQLHVQAWNKVKIISNQQ